MSKADYKGVMRNSANPVVFFDVEQSRKKLGRIVMELYNDVTPRTAENFRQLCLGYKKKTGNGKPLHYKGCGFHRVIPQFMIQGGDFTAHNGTGGESIYGRNFADENFKLKHTEPGQLSMANSGRNTNGSQFFITTSRPSHLNGKHCVFGKVIKGYEFVQKIERAPSDRNDKPRQLIVIADCGEILEAKKAVKKEEKKVEEAPKAAGKRNKKRAFEETTAEEEAPVQESGKKFRKVGDAGEKKAVEKKLPTLLEQVISVQPPKALLSQLQERNNALNRRTLKLKSRN